MDKELLNKEKIIETLLQNSDRLKGFGVNKIGLFGSYVRNESSIKSDIDFFVEFYPKKKNYKNFIHLAYFLEDLFKTKVDLLTSNSISPYLRPHIIKEVEYVSISH